MNETDELSAGLSPDGIFPGNLLRVGRERLGLSLDDAARQLHLTKFYVQALESGDFSRLPKPPFVRGYIKAYAKLLGQPEHIWLGPYEQMVGVQEQPRIAPLPNVGKVKRQARITDPLMRILTILFLLALAVLSLLWWKEQHQFTNPSEIFHNLISKITVSTLEGDKQIVLADPAEENNSVSLPLSASQINASVTGDNESAPTAAADEAAMNNIAPSTETANTESAVTASTAPVGPSADVAIATEPGATSDQQVVDEDMSNATAPAQDVPAGPPGTDYVVIKFKSDCWFQLQDGDGKRLMAAIKSTGDEVAMHVKPPVRLVIGYMPGIESISIDSNAVDISQYAGRDVVRMTLPQN
ncbi:hypothetical protein WH50_05895 [Pokkaliibacter plantistimulans]|uniref:Cytoskeleton protein RodZ-like C-terminal domain-containing protein n=1 Tax=Pokkaliibacter plantistimulans TaxID=1635171 RepID=A0ABX5M3L7_9GAMM|nr:RodZ domain-containing protein [Pokkaliibacter plantistimulans]PXF32253.1 hypothetical protein WH50_05895 [Pokkaliibacter plantistimulans]